VPKTRVNLGCHQPAPVRRLITEANQADVSDDCGRSPHEPKQAEKDHIYVVIFGLSLGDVLFHISNFMIQTVLVRRERSIVLIRSKSCRNVPSRKGEESRWKEDDLSLHPQSPQDASKQDASKQDNSSQDVSNRDNSNQDVSNELHPVVYKAVAALFVWFVAAAWLLFGGPGYIGLALAVISVLVGGTIAMLTVLLRIGAKARTTRADSVANQGEAAEETKPFDAWLQGDFSTWTDRQKGTTAAIEILLPIAAVALGIAALGIVFDLVREGVM
jgi:hypothetical protein